MNAPTQADVMGIILAMSNAWTPERGMPRLAREYRLWYSRSFDGAVRSLLGDLPVGTREAMRIADFSITPRVIERDGVEPVWYLEEVR